MPIIGNYFNPWRFIPDNTRTQMRFVFYFLWTPWKENSLREALSLWGSFNFFIKFIYPFIHLFICTFICTSIHSCGHVLHSRYVYIDVVRGQLTGLSSLLTGGCQGQNSGHQACPQVPEPSHQPPPWTSV